MDLEYNVSIFRQDETNSAKVCVWRAISEERFKVFIPTIDKDEIRWGWKEQSATVVPPASFKIPVTFEKRGVMQKLSDQLFDQYGVKPSNTMNEDVMDVMKDHLEDLRRIIFRSDYTHVERGAPLVAEEVEKNADI